MPGCPLSSGITSILRKNVAQEEDITLITNEVNIHHIITFMTINSVMTIRKNRKS